MSVRAIERAGCQPGSDAAISLDIAASEFGARRPLSARARQPRARSRRLAEMLLDWIERYPIVSIEDPFAEDDRRRRGSRSRARRGIACRSSATTSSRRTPTRIAAAARDAGVQRGADQGQPGGHAHRDAAPRSTPRKAAGFGDDRLGALRRIRGLGDRASRRRLERRPAQGRLVRAQRADGEVERGAAHRGRAGRGRALRGRGGAAADESRSNLKGDRKPSARPLGKNRRR